MNEFNHYLLQLRARYFRKTWNVKAGWRFTFCVLKGDDILGKECGVTIDSGVGLWDNRSREVLEKLGQRSISDEGAGVRM